ncbi:hypothetical protein D3C71_1849710 [compost metagenome]
MKLDTGEIIYDLGAFCSNTESGFLATAVGNDYLAVRRIPSDRAFYECSENVGRNIYFISILNDIDILPMEGSTVNAERRGSSVNVDAS